MSEHSDKVDVGAVSMESVFEAMDLGIAIFDAKLHILNANETFKKFLDFADVCLDTQTSLRDVYRALAQSGAFGSGVVDDIVNAHMAARKDNKREQLLTAPTGQLLQIKWYPLPNGCLCATLLDTTVDRETQEQLRQASKLDAIGRLTGGVAHDFNNVLAVVYGNLELLKDELKNPANHQLVDMAMAAAERGAKLTHRLLAFARKQPLSPEVCSPSAVLSELVPMVRSLLGEQIEVELVCDAGIWQIEVDRNQLEIVLVNIAINARDSMKDGGKLTIEALNARVDDHYAEVAEINRGQYVCIACTDTGKGMSKSIVEKVFEPFFTTKDAASGTGLGLAMAHGFVKQSNGHIKIYSELDVGTVVKIYLPRATTGESEQIGDLHQSNTEAMGKQSILLVEDDAQIRQTVTKQLETAGYVVFAVSDANKALDIFNSHPVDLVLTDVVLPRGVNGKMLADKVREVKPDMPVIYMSGYTENAIIHQGRLDKDVTLLQKPFRKADLLRAVANVFT